MKFYYVYILKSLKKDFLYVGYTKNLKRRVAQHNNKKELSTKYYASFDLIHYEAYRNGKDAKRREKYLKTSKGKTTLRTMLREYLKVK
jgi:putative endonuclease